MTKNEQIKQTLLETHERRKLQTNYTIICSSSVRPDRTDVYFVRKNI